MTHCSYSCFCRSCEVAITCGNPYPIFLHIHISVVYSMYTSAHMFLCLQSLCTCDHSPTHLRWLKNLERETSHLRIIKPHMHSCIITMVSRAILRTLPQLKSESFSLSMVSLSYITVTGLCLPGVDTIKSLNR